MLVTMVTRKLEVTLVTMAALVAKATMVIYYPSGHECTYVGMEHTFPPPMDDLKLNLLLRF